ncbi:PAS domain-containing sensor histidine kinase [Hymenobacter sp. BT770]|uniref:PAS domain-containing sensor histidine kinase n=1 Tax=Hymenobacter sp. BT770 TaxID=2886942 RepID=UPI001D12912A|nr:PAS domain-containing sensor histidine kinase [Hymenobacter sp. BT770]MCC3151485.1 PAS domain-containing sensor histidine kinase [Hymenobacter sp. BT770]MDO3413939.1 PAS domain-containing sensor histidine kinase [Hymenobacter sp. BT770]
MLNPDTQLERTPFERSAEAVFVLDGAGNFLRANSRFAHLLGYPAAQLHGTSFLHYLSPEEAEQGQQYLARAAAGEVVSYQASVLGNGEPLVLDFQLLPVLTADERTAGVYGIARPLADQPPLNAALVEREQQLSVIFNAIADVTFVLNVEDDGRYRFIFANKAFERTTGIPPEKVAGSYVDAIIPEPSLALVLQKYQEAVTTLERVVWQETSDYPTGRVTGEVSVTPVCDEAGRCHQLVGVVHDLTKEKQVEEALRASNERFVYVLKATNDAVYDWNVVEDTLYWGEGFAFLFGYQLKQNPVSFSGWADYVHPDDTHRTVAGLQRVVYETTDSFWEDEYRFHRADGSWAVVMDRGYILRDAAGHALRMIGAMQDITPRKQAEERQRLLTERLARQNSDLQQFTYIVSHNLRAPLANALGFSDLLSRVDKQSEVFDQSVQNLRTSLLQLDQVLTDVNDILSLRDEQGGYRPEPVAVAAVCREALLGLQESLRACGGELHSNIPETLRVLGSRAYFHSIFYNLVSNSIKYRSDERPLRIDITATVGPNADTTITVRDNGLGISQEKGSEEIFQLYRRFHTDKAGRGVGLYLVKAHMEAMGGQIIVRSQVNEGTEFILYFRQRADENLPD